jgi:hypothetical protein
MNCDSWDEPKNSRTAAAAGFGVDQVLRHDRVDIDRRHALLDRPLHAQQAQAVLVLHELADRAHPAVAEVVDVVDLALAVAQVHERLGDRQDVLLAQHAHGVLGVEVEAHVHLDAARPPTGRSAPDRRTATGTWPPRSRRRRLAGAHHAVDVEQRVLAVLVLVDASVLRM